MFVVGVGAAAGNTTEIAAVSGTNGPGLNVAVNDFSLTSNFDNLAASLRALVFSLCQSTMTVTKLVDGQPANDWDVTATITSVTGAPGFDWRFPSEPATPPASRTLPTAGAGTATFDWVVGSEAEPVPGGSVEMTIDEVAQAGFLFTGGTCNIDSATGTDRDVVIATLPFNIGTIPFDAIVRCTLNNQTIPPTTPPTTPATTPPTTPATTTPTTPPTTTPSTASPTSVTSAERRRQQRSSRSIPAATGTPAPHRRRW